MLECYTCHREEHTQCCSLVFVVVGILSVMGRLKRCYSYCYCYDSVGSIAAYVLLDLRKPSNLLSGYMAYTCVSLSLSVSCLIVGLWRNSCCCLLWSFISSRTCGCMLSSLTSSLTIWAGFMVPVEKVPLSSLHVSSKAHVICMWTTGLWLGRRQFASEKLPCIPCEVLV